MRHSGGAVRAAPYRHRRIRSTRTRSMAPAWRRVPSCAQSHRAAVARRARGASRAPLRAEFVFGAANTNFCPPGFSKIVLEAVCRSAAGAVGRQYSGTLTGAAYPSGCIFYNGGQAGFQFNAHRTGAPNPNYRPLCAGAAAAQPCVRVCVRVRACVCVCSCARARVCMYLFMSVCIDRWKYACMRACVHACMHICTYVCMYVCMYACMHVCM